MQPTIHSPAAVRVKSSINTLLFIVTVLTKVSVLPILLLMLLPDIVVWDKCKYCFLKARYNAPLFFKIVSVLGGEEPGGCKTVWRMDEAVA